MFVERMRRLPDHDDDPSRPLLWTLDFNVTMMSSIVAQLHRIPRKQIGWEPKRKGLPPEAIYEPAVKGVQPVCIYFLDELRLASIGVQGVVEAFLEAHGERAKRVGLILYGDGSGGNRSPSTCSSV